MWRVKTWLQRTVIVIRTLSGEVFFIIKHVVPTNQSDCLKHLSNSADNDDACTLGNTWGKGHAYHSAASLLQRWLHFLVYKLPSEPAASETGITSCR